MVKIIADSTCDLSKELKKKYEITTVPLHIVLGDQEYRDGLEITSEEIYEWSEKHKTTPKTSAVSLEDAMSAMKPHLESGSEIVAFSIAGGMSTTGNVLRLAAEELDASEKVFVIDSQSLSTGIALLVIEAAIMAKEGKTGSEIAAHMETLKRSVRASFIVDTLTYLHRGGRCSGLAAMAGGVLRLHPKIEVKNGEMAPAKKYRGKLSAVILNYVKDMEEELLCAKKDRVFIVHSNCSDEIVESVRAYLDGMGRFDEILVMCAGGVISSHCGPGTLGVMFLAQG